MKLNGGIYFNENGLTTSIRSMHLQTALMSIGQENVMGFDKVGYQKKEAVVSKFSEFLGIHGLSTVLDDSIGRLSATKNSLDLAINQKGYFQFLQEDGSIKLSRDGRLKLTKDGDLLSLEGNKILGSDGMPIKFTLMPQSSDDIKISKDGNVCVFDTTKRKLVSQGQIGVVSAQGATVVTPDVRQGFVESSNISLYNEFLGLVPIKRNFEANRQLFIIQNNNLSNTIEKLGTV